MSDHRILDPAEFTIEVLSKAARGGLKTLQPQHAVTLIHAKLGKNAEAYLAELARDDAVDRRARYAATLALASFPTAHDLLVALSASPDHLVAGAARRALDRPV
ncbi:hypothetical protein ACW9HR_35850 [Nocardia gipuzkoensis]